MPVQRANTAPRDHVAPAAEHATGTTHVQPRRTRGYGRDARRAPGALESTGSQDRVDHPEGATTANHAHVSGSGVRDIMHARLKAMAEPRSSDSPELARLRRLMRDPDVAADLTANVDQWPAPTDEQRDLVAAMLQQHRRGR